MKETLTSQKKRLDADILIVGLVSLAVLAAYIALQSPLVAFVKDGRINILLRVAAVAAFQFGIAGLGITIVSILRKESFASYGLRKKGAALSVVLCFLCFVPYIIFTAVTHQTISWLPFQSVWTTREILASGFPANVAGMAITAVAWGFFEGFNYVVVCDKINKRYPSKNKWLNWGAIACAVFCILIHGAIGVTVEGIIGMLTVVTIIYGMLMVKQHTGNAWGCVFTFLLLWNAF